jgi:hypothetical protein
MNHYPRRQVRELQHQVESAEYHVDSHAVADAIVRRRWAVAVAVKPAPTSLIPSSSWDRVPALAA